MPPMTMRTPIRKNSLAEMGSSTNGSLTSAGVKKT
eukprot:CAMPEP_0197687162 /NCGR_PEP_ID=MMETSP1338-20131121/103599_1 /TAXON_ID=43686 ORGANISM="Pelagodinium beii, Strain RCC1491" /NCGR_SAMPLE_ID=MMETSP1338 /ASSEMBLY_ACC=CAM_ASM_000754 /LENGTH=34 /DNA_ID= /DNA_START= /DNA_END= /DNA_ORIENTATION=